MRPNIPDWVVYAVCAGAIIYCAAVPLVFNL